MRGTLKPLRLTANWDLAKASELATPHLVAVYTERGTRKGVLVVQRQLVLRGAIADSHAMDATLSVYVFALDGDRWVFEKGKKEAARAGAHGAAPAGRLVRLGEERFGLLFEVGDVRRSGLPCAGKEPVPGRLDVRASVRRVYDAHTVDAGSSPAPQCLWSFAAARWK